MCLFVQAEGGPGGSGGGGPGGVSVGGGHMGAFLVNQNAILFRSIRTQFSDQSKRLNISPI